MEEVDEEKEDKAILTTQPKLKVGSQEVDTPSKSQVEKRSPSPSSFMSEEEKEMALVCLCST